MSTPTTKRYFSPQARQTATETRRLIAAAKPAFGTPEMFVIRLADAPLFGWEIRKFGGLILGRSEMGFETQSLARKAGLKVLESMSTKDLSATGEQS